MHCKNILLVFSWLSVAMVANSVQAADPQSGAEGLDGTWLFDAAVSKARSEISRFWTSQVAINGDTFSIRQFMNLSKELTGKFVLDSATTPKTIDLKIDELDFAAGGAPVAAKIPACTLHGVCELANNRLTICFPLDPAAPRPATVDAKGDKIARIFIVRAPADFTEFPKEITVTAHRPDGRPAAGAIVTAFMSMLPGDGQEHLATEWKYNPSLKTNDNGMTRFEYEELRFHPIIVRDPIRGLMAIETVTPVSLLSRKVAITLKPECRVSGSIVCSGGEPQPSRLLPNVYANHDGQRVAFCSSRGPNFEFILPAGDYSLHAYGYELSHKDVPISVPPDRPTYSLDPITLTPSPFLRLLDRPAPELDGVVAWKGTPVRFNDLKGKVVLLDFWGYWCNPCVQQMPVLIELHEKFANRGLVIIGVHVDADGEIDTVAKLDEKIAVYKKGIWKDKDLPFPIALSSGAEVGKGDNNRRGVTAAQYSVSSYPTTILIGRDGRIMGDFSAHDAKLAIAQIEKLLENKSGR
jgi:uncharacterized protein (TIGR03067 family)